MAKKDFFNQDTLISDNEELIIIKNASIYARGIYRLEAHGKSKRLSNKAFGIGRDKHNAVIISDSSVSKFHATVTFKKATGYITDTHSSNGILINGKKITTDKPVKLFNNDIIIFGKTKITYFC